MDFFDKWAKYAPIAAQILMSILVLHHWYKGIELTPILTAWLIFLGLSISPILDIFYGNDK